MAEINPSGTAYISLSTLPGGSEGAPGGIAVDSAGDAYITGSTTGNIWPITPGAFQSTYVANGCCVATFGHAYVTKITGLQVPGVMVSPTSLPFATQPVGTSVSQTITVNSSGNLPLSISAIIITGDYSQTNNCPLAPATLAVGASCAINVTFLPRGTGIRPGDIGITTNGWDGHQGIHLTGIGTSGTAQLSPTSLTFASQHVATTSAAQSVTLSNIGFRVARDPTESLRNISVFHFVGS